VIFIFQLSGVINKISKQMVIERLLPNTIEWDLYHGNHIFRYMFANNLLKKTKAQKILDAACGVGYGAKYLAETNNIELIAIDKSYNALDVARKFFNDPHITYIQDDCHFMDQSLSHAPFDLIVSFETLEHLPRPKDFLDNCYKALNKGGHLVISTPNAEVTSPTGVVDWEFHEKEYTHQELTEILNESGFKIVELLGQGYSTIGLLRQDIRFELNRLNSNPFVRIGKFIQKVLRGHKQSAVLPEKIEDFELVSFENIENKKPFVLIAVAVKD